ncbi:MAG: hypothetical protein ACUVX8_06080 [Candidatus Zipacnadales bacterium]
MTSVAAAEWSLPAWQVEAGFTLTPPPGWIVERELPGVGMTLRPPEQDAPMIELTVWRLSVGVVSATEAAAEHERLLRHFVWYERTHLQPITTPTAGPGVLVRGLVRATDGCQAEALFAVFARAGRGYLLGLFTTLGGSEEAQRAYLKPALEGFTLSKGVEIMFSDPSALEFMVSSLPDRLPAHISRTDYSGQYRPLNRQYGVS